MPKIAPCLWFDDQAEAAAKFYVSVFKNARILTTSYFTQEGHKVHGRAAGSVMVVSFELDGQRFTALNGGPLFKFNEAISLQVECKNQEEIDYYWEKLAADGGSHGQCGWLKDKFGLSWQVAPAIMQELVTDPDRAQADAKVTRVMAVTMKMTKLDIAALQKAARG